MDRENFWKNICLDSTKCNVTQQITKILAK